MLLPAPFSRRAAARAKLVDTARRFGLQVDPEARVAGLSVGERQRVEILKALVSFGTRKGAKVLILDEPTAVLTPPEVVALFDTLQQLVAQGLGVIFISHKLDEVLRVSHRVAVLRGGKLVATVDAKDASKASLAALMVGRDVAVATRTPRTPDGGHATPGEVVCALRGVTVAGAGHGARLASVDLDLRAGEIVAIAGVAGNGQQALAELLFGMRAPDGGTLRLGGKPLPARPQAWVRAGVARIPEDRHAVGVVGELPVWENAVLERYATPAFAHGAWWGGVMKRAAAQAHARTVIERFDVRGTQSAGLETPTRALSGGNMQKLILGRALLGDPGVGDPGAGNSRVADPASGDTLGASVPRLIVADQPTWGLDIGAVAYVHQQLLDACARGAAVLLISEDLDEIFAVADRIAVIHAGRLTAAKPVADWTLAEIGLAMAGEHGERGEHNVKGATDAH